ncbi:MAG: ABC transporter ATP-binding protein [Bacillota bacterium]
MPDIKIKDLSTEFCLKKMNFTIKDGELMVLLGPSGSGKTTLLKAIAGIVDYSGSIYFGENNVNNLVPGKRNVGYLFQNINLFPHLNVYDNIAYGLKTKGFSKDEIKEKVEHIIDLFNITELKERYSKNLSGGEKQRIALARALVYSPDILLLDEPMSSLDYRISKHLRMEIKMLQRKLNITTVYVTHNFSEAEEMADRIAVINNGVIEQVDIADRVFFKPKNKNVTEFIGEPNIFICSRCKEMNLYLKEIKCGKLNFVVASPKKSIRKIAILPEDIYVSKCKPPGPDINRVKAELIEIKKNSTYIECVFMVDRKIKVKMAADIYKNMKLSKNDTAWLTFNFKKIKVLNGDI